MNRPNLTATWYGNGKLAKCAPNPDFPNGKPLDFSRGSVYCEIELEHPAPCIGAWVIECKQCGIKVALTAAGRVDDPSTIKLGCKACGPDL